MLWIVLAACLLACLLAHLRTLDGLLGYDLLLLDLLTMALIPPLASVHVVAAVFCWLARIGFGPTRRRGPKIGVRPKQAVSRTHHSTSGSSCSSVPSNPGQARRQASLRSADASCLSRARVSRAKQAVACDQVTQITPPMPQQSILLALLRPRALVRLRCLVVRRQDQQLGNPRRLLLAWVASKASRSPRADGPQRCRLGSRCFQWPGMARPTGRASRAGRRGRHEQRNSHTHHSSVQGRVAWYHRWAPVRNKYRPKAAGQRPAAPRRDAKFVKALPPESDGEVG